MQTKQRSESMSMPKTCPSISSLRTPARALLAAIGISSLLNLPATAQSPPFNDAHWSSLGSGVDGLVMALAVSGGNVYVGGQFTTADSIAANRIAMWDGTNWSALGSGMDFITNSGVPSVNALAVLGNSLYAGGYFEAADGMPANNIAKWDGTNWSALGSGVEGPVDALAVLDGNLYIGGNSMTAGDAHGIAKWNGTNWSALGSGVSGGVYALAVSGKDLYAAGGFNMAGGVAATNVAKWNGTSWSALGLGVPHGFLVYALAVSGRDVYVGGYIGGSVPKLARWDGTNWSSVGGGTGGGTYNIVQALVVSGSDLYVGGDFTTAGGIPASNIAKWDGTRWSALGSGTPGGVSSIVRTLAVSGSDLYAGGGFMMAGGQVSPHVAKAIVYSPILAIEPDGSGGYFIRFTGAPGDTYSLQRASSLAGPWTTSASQTIPASGYVEFQDLFPPPGQGFYRSVQP